MTSCTVQKRLDFSWGYRYSSNTTGWKKLRWEFELAAAKFLSRGLKKKSHDRSEKHNVG